MLCRIAKYVGYVGYIRSSFAAGRHNLRVLCALPFHDPTIPLSDADVYLHGL